MTAARRVRITAMMLALLASAGCGPSRKDQMTDLDGLVFHLSYTNWKYYAGHGAANGRRAWSYMDWSTDGCSAPLIGNGPWDFYFPCTRHDFSWRNLSGSTASSPPTGMSGPGATRTLPTFSSSTI